MGWPIFIRSALLTLLGFGMCSCCSCFILARGENTYSSQVVRTALMTGMARLIESVDAELPYPEGSSFSSIVNLGRLGSVLVKFSYLNIACLYTAVGGNTMISGDSLQRAFRALLHIHGEQMIQAGASLVYAEIGRVTLQYYRVGRTPRSTSSFSPSSVKNNTIAFAGNANSSPSTSSSPSPTTDEKLKTSLQFKLQDLMYPPGSTKDCNTFASTLLAGPAEHPYAVLQNGGSLQSPNQLFTLRMQADCNLVLYAVQGKAIWSSKTNGLGTGCRLHMQPDGNLVVYDDNNEALWSSKTNCDPWPCVVPAALMVQDDGNAVIYETDEQKCLWASANDN